MNKVVLVFYSQPNSKVLLLISDIEIRNKTGFKMFSNQVQTSVEFGIMPNTARGSLIRKTVFLYLQSRVSSSVISDSM